MQYELLEATDSSVRQPAENGIGYRTHQQGSYYDQILALEAAASRRCWDGDRYFLKPVRARMWREANALRSLLARTPGCEVPPARKN